MIKWWLILELGPKEKREDRILIKEDLSVASLALTAKLLGIFQTYLALFVVELRYKKFPKYAFVEEWFRIFVEILCEIQVLKSPG